MFSSEYASFSFILLSIYDAVTVIQSHDYLCQTMVTPGVTQPVSHCIVHCYATSQSDDPSVCSEIELYIEYKIFYYRRENTCFSI